MAINRANAWVRHADWAMIRPADWGRNLRQGWEWDVDGFMTNMFGHPYGGGFYYNAARANGLGFWGAAPLVFVGSGLWEYFGETERPSLNDLYMTGFGGIVYGEVGHRISGVIRDNAARGPVRILRELAAFPFDPVGGAHRLLSGRATRVSTDPEDRDRTPLALELQGGARLAIDSGAARARSASATFLADIAYGDAFAASYRQPFDVFRVRLQFSPRGGGVNQVRARGRLYGYDLTNAAAVLHHVFTVTLKSEYLASPSYKFGGQSLEAGVVSDLALTETRHVQTELFAEWLLLGGLDAPGSGVRERTYDFGPGLGINAAASLLVGRATVVSARWRFADVHAVSGSRADHSTHFLSVEGDMHLTRKLGLGGSAGWYRQRSTYGGTARATITAPEFRAYLTWRSRRGPAAPGGTPL